MTKEEQLQHVHDLIAVARDGELGYRTAAEHVDDSHLSEIFAEYAKQRAGFVQELSSVVEETPADSGTFTGAVFRGWMNLKSAVTGGGPEAIVAACETGEDSAQAAYERVVNLDASGKLRTVAESQLEKIREAHRRMLQ